LTLVKAAVLRFDIVLKMESGMTKKIRQTIFSFAQTEALKTEKEA
jgi:hypothetical protein